MQLKKSKLAPISVYIFNFLNKKVVRDRRPEMQWTILKLRSSHFTVRSASVRISVKKELLKELGSEY